MRLVYENALLSTKNSEENVELEIFGKNFGLFRKATHFFNLKKRLSFYKLLVATGKYDLIKNKWLKTLLRGVFF